MEDSKFKSFEVAYEQSQIIANELGFATSDDVQKLLGVTSGTLVTWRKTGEGPIYCYVGNTFLYPKEDLKDYILSKRKVSKTAAARQEALG